MNGNFTGFMEEKERERKEQEEAYEKGREWLTLSLPKIVCSPKRQQVSHNKLQKKKKG